MVAFSTLTFLGPLRLEKVRGPHESLACSMKMRDVHIAQCKIAHTHIAHCTVDTE